MGRLLGVIMGLLAELVLVWVCWGNDIPGQPSPSRSDSLPQQTVPSTQPQEETETSYDPVAGAMLIARSLLPYDGPALWDKEGDMSGVAALELWNAGERGIQYAQILVRQEDRELVFTATYIPPGGTVVVPEANAHPYSKGAVTEIEFPVVVSMEDGWRPDGVSVTENGAFSLTVTNETQETIPCVRIFYKQYDAQRGVYVGIVTYSIVISDLKPGESRTVMPYAYAADHAKVVAVVTERKTGDS